MFLFLLSLPHGGVLPQHFMVPDRPDVSVATSANRLPFPPRKSFTKACIRTHRPGTPLGFQYKSRLLAVCELFGPHIAFASPATPAPHSSLFQRTLHAGLHHIVVLDVRPAKRFAGENLKHIEKYIRSPIPPFTVISRLRRLSCLLVSLCTRPR